MKNVGWRRHWFVCLRLNCRRVTSRPWRRHKRQCLRHPRQPRSSGRVRERQFVLQQLRFVFIHLMASLVRTGVAPTCSSRSAVPPRKKNPGPKEQVRAHACPAAGAAPWISWSCGDWLPGGRGAGSPPRHKDTKKGLPSKRAGWRGASAALRLRTDQARRSMVKTDESCRK